MKSWFKPNKVVCESDFTDGDHIMMPIRIGRVGRTLTKQFPKCLFSRCAKDRHCLLLIPLYLLLATIGVYASFLGTRTVILKSAEERLRQDAVDSMQRSDAAAEEARVCFAAIKATRSPYCSNEELDSFGSLLYRSRFLRDAGHIRNGAIDCSTALGRTRKRIPLKNPFLVLPDGTTILLDPSLPQDDGDSAFMLRSGNDFVIIGSNLLIRYGTSRVHYTFTVVDPQKRNAMSVVGAPLRLPRDLLSRNGTGHSGESLYATVCSTKHSDCITASIPITEEMHQERRLVMGGIAAGCLLDTIVGLAIVILDIRRCEPEQQLRRALKKDQLSVVYQPIIDLKNRRFVGAEALVRWNNEYGENVSPEVLIPMAERLGLIGQVTRAVLRRSLRDLEDILRDPRDFRLSINVTVTELLGSDLLPLLDEEVGNAHVSPKSLALEITEGTTACHTTLAESIHRLRCKGFSIYIDDFGTGYSSLSYLRDLSVDAIKVDRGFTQTIGRQAVSTAILPKILELADHLDLQVIVEGVETLEQANYLMDGPGRVLAQGWYFARPMGGEELCGLFEQDASRRSGLPEVLI